MRRILVSILTVAVALVAVSSAMAAEGGDRVADLEKRVAELEKEKGTSPESFRVYWKNGLKFDSNDGEFQMQVGGRIMNDWMWWISP